MTESGIHSIDIMLVLPDEELWGAEQLRADLGASGLRLMRKEEFRSGPPAAILIFLAGQMEPDSVLCRKWVGQGLAPVIAVSANHAEPYVLALFAAGVEDVIQRPIRPHELAARIRSILRRARPGLQLRPVQSASGPQTPPPPRPRQLRSFIHGLRKRFAIKKKVKGDFS